MSVVRISFREKNGTMYAIVGITLGLLTSLALAGFLFVRVIGAQVVQGNAVEAAALVAAREIARVVIEDPCYGYISLCDYPPIGKGTIAADGESLPVYGINTIVATARRNCMLAEKLDSSEFLQLAHLEAQEARRASIALNLQLTQVLKNDPKYVAHDYNGAIVNPYKEAKASFLANLSKENRGFRQELIDLSLSYGWQTGVVGSLIIPPRSRKLDELPANSIVNGQYRAFMELPFAGESFYFAGLGERPELVNSHEFRSADGKHLCSSVLARARVATITGEPRRYLLDSTACALPGGNTFAFPAATFVLSFPHGIPQGINSFADLLGQSQLSRNRFEVYTSIGGDYPKDASARLTTTCLRTGTTKPTVSQGLSQAIYDWISSVHGKLEPDELLVGFKRPFREIKQLNQSGIGSTYIMFDIDSQGNLLATASGLLPFQYQLVQERQLFLQAPIAFNASGANWTMTCYDQVANKGAVFGGNHAGQALGGNPVNWCELSTFGGSFESAMRFGKGGKAFGVHLSGQPILGLSAQAVATDSAQFQTQTGKQIPLRKSYYSGGLAGFVEVSMAFPDDIGQ